MSFDPSTAQAIHIDFDPSTARDISSADSSKEMRQAKENVTDPTLYGLRNTFDQAIVNPIYQGINAIEPAVKGLVKGFGVPEDKNNIYPIQGPDMSNAPFIAKLAGDVAGGFSKGAGAVVAGGGNPFLGYGSLSGLEAYGKGENPIPAAVKGTLFAIPQYVAGKLGSSLATVAAKPLGNVVQGLAPRVGTATGMGLASAGQAAMTGGNPVEAGATGSTFGLMSPMNPLGAPKEVTQAEHNDMISKAADTYRKILNPGKGIINKIEVKNGKDLNDSFKLAAKEGLVINKDINGKLDTSGAIDQLKNSTAPLYEQQNNILASNPDMKFNIDELAKKAQSNIDNPDHPAYIKSASEAAVAKGRIKDEADAEILRNKNSSLVNGEQLNTIKQGLWSKSYNYLDPNANDGARALGFTAKDAIEKAYPDQSIKENNAQLGKYLDLQKILEQSHGQVIQGGKLGKYASRITGLGVGGLAGHAAGVPGAEAAGAVIGQEAGAKIQDFINDPQRITSNLANKIKNVKITDQNVHNSQSIKSDIESQSEFNPLKNAQQGTSSDVNVKKGILGNRGQIGSNDMEDINRQRKYISFLETQSRTAATPEIRNDAAIRAELERRKMQENKGVSSSLIGGLGMGLALGTSAILGAPNANAKDQERLQLPAAQYTQKEEGFKPMPYMDTKGVKTIGYGFNMTDPTVSKLIPQSVMEHRRALTQDEANNIYGQLYSKAQITAQKFSGGQWPNLSDNQRKALTDMAYQMPGKINGFKNLKTAIQGGNFNTAAREILNSDYARKDSPNRANRNSILIRS